MRPFGSHLLRAPPLLLLAPFGCTRPTPADTATEPFTCAETDELCGLYDADPEGFAVTLPTESTFPLTGWKTNCYTSEAEVRAGEGYGETGEIVPSPGLWLDFTIGGVVLFRHLDCSFATWTSHPYDIANDEGDEVGGLPVGWRFTAETEPWQVEELVLGVETSWEYRYGTECCGGDGPDRYHDALYDWTTRQDGDLTRWQFCHVSTAWQRSHLECREYAYDPAAQMLGGRVTTSAEPLDCLVE